MSEPLFTHRHVAAIAEPAPPPLRPHGRELAPAYRLYVDEVGDASFRNCHTTARRFLSLTGVALHLAAAAETVAPDLERLKRDHFGAHPDDERRLVLHRRDILNRNGPFGVLLQPERAAAFDAALFEAFERWPYTVFTVVLDKHAFRERHPTDRPEAYAHALEAVVGCYAAWLAERAARGDVMVESRAGKDDRRLKDAYTELLTTGGPDVDLPCLLESLTSRQLKVRNKTDAVPGLQLADLLAHPSAGALRARHGHGERPADFGGRVVDLLDLHKYARLRDGQVANMGLLWIPGVPA